MNVFESINNTSDKAVDTGGTYIKKTRKYYKLKVFYQLTHNLSLLAKALIIGSVLFMGLIFLTVALAIYLGELLGNIALGYLVVGGLFFLIALTVYLLRSLIDTAIITKIQTSFFKS